MAYIVRTALGGTADAATFTPVIPTHASGDLILCCVTNTNFGTTISTATSGWSMIGTQAASATTRQAWAYKIAASSSEANPTFSGSNDRWVGHFIIVKDHDAASPIDGWQRGDWASVSTKSSNSVAASSNGGSVISAAADSLLFYSWGATGSCQMRCQGNDLISDAIYSVTLTTSVSQIVGHRQHGASGSVPDVTMYAASSTHGGNCWVISIKNASGGQLQQDARLGGDEFQWYGQFGQTHSAFGTAAAPSTLDDDQGSPPANVTIAGINGSTSAATVTHTENVSMAASAPLSTTTQIDSAEVTSGAWVGAVQTLGSNKDMSGKIFGVHFAARFLSEASMGSNGVVVAFADSSGRWTAYQMCTKDHISVNGYSKDFASFVSVGNADVLGSDGTTDWTAIKKIGWFYHRAGSQTNNVYLFLKDAALWDTAVITGGSSGNPVTWPKFNAMSQSWYLFALSDLQASAQLQGKYPIQIGDGTKKTYFKATASSFEFPKDHAVDTSSSQQQWNVGSGSAGITIYASASDTVDLSAALFATETPQPFTIDASSSTSAVYSVVGASFVGWDVTWKTGVTCSGATFSGCSEINFKGASVANCTISNTTSTDAACAFDTSGGELDNCTIDVTGTSALYHVELGTACDSITLTDVTFTGTPGTDKVHVKKTTGTVTITISGTTALVAGDVTSDGATVVIAAPQPVLDATVLGSSRVVLYNDTTDAELDNTAPGGTSWSKTITSGASIGDTLTLHVFKEGYEEFSTSFLYSGADTTLLVTQTVHPHIASLRTELGISDYTTITEFALDITGTVEIDADDADGNSQKARLAVWYNGILTTEDGARYLRGAISILSTAAIRINVNIIDLQVTNISGTFGLNFTDTERRLYRSDGTPVYSGTSAPGSIQNDYSGVPDTVETGVSGLTGPESAQLLGLPSADAVATAVWSKDLPL
jgi:hypothetical protein